MNVLMINGSPKPNGNTAIALREMEQIFVQEGIQVETVHVGNKDIRGCIGCGRCSESCPSQVIRIEQGKARIRYKHCIRCYCCQELCPQTAVDVFQPFFMKWLR